MHRSLPGALAALILVAAAGAASVPASAAALRSDPDLRPPAITITRHTAAAEPGFLLLGPKITGPTKTDAQQGAVVADDRGRIRWFSPSGQQGTDVRVQTYQGQPVLTYWRGATAEGHGEGADVVLNARYHVVARITGSADCRPDVHEFRLTPQNTALILCYHPTRRDLRPVGGARNARVLDCIVEEVDVATGKVLFRWSGLDHVPLSESHQSAKGLPAGATYDPLHFNSVVKDADGDYLVSARHTWAAYKVDGATGRIVWRLGGKQSDFRLSAGAATAWQHDAEFEAPDRVRIFDNGAGTGDQEVVRRSSRVVTLALDTQAMTATVARSLHHTPGLSAVSQGNAELLPGGNTLVGWGSTGQFSELTPTGALVLDGHLPAGFDTYRAYRAPWVGTPSTRPAVAASPSGSGTGVYASWNGSTEVARWQVLAGASPSALAPSGTPVDWDGLETTIRIPGHPAYVAVRALDATGATLAESAAVRPSAADRR